MRHVCSAALCQLFWHRQRTSGDLNLMPLLYDQIACTLPEGMRIPEPLELLFAWIEDNGLYVDTDEGGQRTGFLFPRDQIEAGSTDEERPGGTIIDFAAEDNILKCWFGHENREVLNRLCVFARTGGDGSMAAFWLDDEG